MTGRATYAGALALAAALTLMTGSPALAASPNESVAAAASGPILAAPMGTASFPGQTPVTLVSAKITRLLTTGPITDTADALAASSTVSHATVTLTELVTLAAASVSSSCGFDTNTDTVSGNSAISAGELELPKTTIPLSSDPAPNTTVTGLGDLATVTLNAQSTSGDGRLTVTALQITMAASAQTLSIGVSTCNGADLEPVPVLPGKSVLAAIGAAALALAGTIFQRRRRPRST